MRLNLGCGSDVREGYINADLLTLSCRDVVKVDLTVFPWPWRDAEEILMLDVLEHFSYRLTDTILQEIWFTLKTGGFVEIQVPDFDHCAMAAMKDDCLCNVCANKMYSEDKKCAKCNTPFNDIAQAAMNRLYGGQDYEGNWHYTAFTKSLLEHKLKRIGFSDIEFLDKNENGETYFQNWNFKVRAFKSEDAWG